MLVTFWPNPERTRELRLAFLLALACASFFALCSPAFSQNASIGIYADPSGNTCSFSGDVIGPIVAYVVVRPDVNGIVGVQFAAPIPSCFHATFLSDIVTPGVLAIGSSQTGVSLAFPGCAGVPYNPLQINYYGTGGTTVCCSYPIVADPGQDGIIANDCAYQNTPIAVAQTHFNADQSCQCLGNSAPNQPSIVSPFENESSVPLQTMLSWVAYDYDNNIASFDVYLGATPSPELIASGVSETSYFPAMLTPLTQYYWRVVVRDDLGLETSGPVWTFTTRAANSPPIVPNSPSPQPGQMNVSVNTSLSWSCGDLDGDPVGYDVYFGSSSPPPLVATNVAVLFLDPGDLSYDTVYYWRVVAHDGINPEVSGPEWSFTARPVNLPPNEPGVVFPWSPSQDNALALTLDWTASDPDPQAIVSDVYFGTQSPPPLVAANREPSSYPVSGLAYSTQYYWRIVVRDEVGAETSGSQWTFTTRPANYPPAAPNLPSPSNLASNVLTTTSLTWQCSDQDGHALAYDVYFGTDALPPLVATNVATTSYNPGTLAELTTYRWRIVARDILGAETAGPIWSFTTKVNVAPSVPSSPSPANGSTNQPINSTFSWNCTDVDGDPITYDVYFGTSVPAPLVAPGVTTRSYAPGPLVFSTTYYWQVVAKDDHGHESNGAAWSFTSKANSPPNPASNLNPPHNSVTAPYPVLTFTATDVDPQQLVYNVYLGTTSPPPLVAFGLTLPSFATSLTATGQYYWRVDVSDGLAVTVGNTVSFTIANKGDVVRDGIITLADASCALQIYLANPSCGGASGAILGDVDCSTRVTPTDARCIHAYVANGSCSFCTIPPSLSVAAVPPEVGVELIETNEDTLSVRLNISGISSLSAFGFETTSGSSRLVHAMRRGATGAFTSLDKSAPTAGTGIVGGYSVTSISIAGPQEFVELMFDISHGLPNQIVIDDFVDDLNGAATLTIPLLGVVNVRPSAPGLMLHQNHPNPFNPQTTIAYEIPPPSSAQRVRLWILDISGRIVATLVDEAQSSGPHDVRWSGRDDRGEAVSSGVYFYVLDVNGERRTRKLVLLK